jgi:hypothetical protein
MTGEQKSLLIYGALAVFFILFLGGEWVVSVWGGLLGGGWRGADREGFGWLVTERGGGITGEVSGW